MNTLVTGVAGFIGSNFVYYYLNAHPDRTIIGIDSLTYAGNLENLSQLSEEEKKRFIFVKSDITNQEEINSLFDKYEIDGVINFAAESHVDRSIHDPSVFLRTNILGTHTLLHVAKSAWSSPAGYKPHVRFLQVSTDEVYGSLGPQGLFHETTPLDPHSPYSASKASADLIVKAYYDTFAMPALITRCSNNYGPYQFPEKLIPLMITRALAHESLPVYGDGKQIRDWLYVEDHCRAIDLVFESGRLGEVYNIGGNNEHENISIVQLIIRLLHEITNDESIHKGLIQYVEDRLGHDRRYGIDATKIQNELGWSPKVSFETGISNTIRWYLENQNWLERIKSGEYYEFYEKNYARRM